RRPQNLIIVLFQPFIPKLRGYLNRQGMVFQLDRTNRIEPGRKFLMADVIVNNDQALFPRRTCRCFLQNSFPPYEFILFGYVKTQKLSTQFNKPCFRADLKMRNSVMEVKNIIT